MHDFTAEPDGDLPGLDKAVYRATANLIGRTGAKNLTFGYLHDDVPIEQADWWAKAQYAGTVLMVEHHTGPDAALTALAERVLTGGQCQRCGRLVALRDDGAIAFPEGTLLDGRRWTKEDAEAAGQCRWKIEDERWEAGCTLPPEGDDELHTAEKLARALDDLNAPRVREIMWRARLGFYHEFRSPLALPLMQLVEDLRAVDQEEMAQRVMAGEFDATKAESAAWMASPEGQGAFNELVSGGGITTSRPPRTTPPTSRAQPKRKPKPKRRTGKKGKR